ncbi:hypothetical protein ES703_101506 [subsurface metagenome]
MKITEKGEKILIKKIAEIFAELPEYNGKVHCNTSVSIEGDVILNFDDPIKKGLIGLFKKRYVSPTKNISKSIK